MFILEKGVTKLVLSYWREDSKAFEYEKDMTDTLSIPFMLLSSSIGETMSDMAYDVIMKRILYEKCYAALSAMRLPAFFVRFCAGYTMDVHRKWRVVGIMQASAYVID